MEKLIKAEAIILVFLFILLILFLIVLTLKIKIEIHNVNFTLHEPQSDLISNMENNSKRRIFNIKDNYKIKISFKILGFLQIFSTKITRKKIDKISKKIKKLNIKSRFKSFNKDTSLLDTRKIIENLNFKIKEFNLKAKIGLDSIMLLTYIIPVLSTIISIILVKKKVKIKNQFYQIKPIYNRRKFIKC